VNPLDWMFALYNLELMTNKWRHRLMIPGGVSINRPLPVGPERAIR